MARHSAIETFSGRYCANSEKNDEGGEAFHVGLMGVRKMVRFG